MLRVLVASSKGGCGKSTIATNLAAHFALQGKATVLADADRQASSSRWCEKRAVLDTAVLPVDATRKGWQQKIPEAVSYTHLSYPHPPSGHLLPRGEGWINSTTYSGRDDHTREIRLRFSAWRFSYSPHPIPYSPPNAQNSPRRHGRVLRISRTAR